MIEYRKIEKSEKPELSALITLVLDKLERKDFLFPLMTKKLKQCLMKTTPLSTVHTTVIN